MCKWIVRLFFALYLIALALLIVGTYGLFGQEKDPLSGVFLLPLGLPWNLLPVEGPSLAIVAPGINLLILTLICRALGRRGG